METEAGFQRLPLVGVSLMLSLIVVSLFLAGLADPAPGRAAPAIMQHDDHSTGAAPGATAATSNTVFLPLVARYTEPIVPNVWKGEYYANDTLSGTPEYTTEEKRVDYDWGDEGAPPGLPANHFSIRWTGYWDFEAGQYTFFVYVDDGVRLWLDGEPLIDRWGPGMGPEQKTVTIATGGLHRLKLEYYEGSGAATIRLHWRRTDLYPQWHGDYYNEPWVENGWQYAHADSIIQFDWGEGCPLGLPCDYFSVAWEAEPLFVTGTHRIYIYADEGHKFFIDGVQMGDPGWNDVAEDVSYVLEASGVEHHRLNFSFHDRGGPAEARLWIVHLEHPTWQIEFYDNVDLSGSPIITDPDGEKVFFDWGLGKPRKKMPSADNFSVHWSGPRYFHAGCYRFGLFADDGVRLWVDGELLVDEWHDGRAEYHSPVTYLSTGYHDVVIEYYEHTGGAEIRFWWE